MIFNTPATIAAFDAANLQGSGGRASDLISNNSSFGSIDIGGLRESLAGLAARDPGFAETMRSDLSSLLSPVEQGQLARHDDVVVTASRSPAGGGEQVTYGAADLATVDRPITVRTYNSTNDLRADEIAFEQRQSETGRLPGDEAIEAGFDAEYARLDGRAAIADRAALDAVKSVIPPLETAAAAYRVGVNGEYTLENGLTLGGSLLGGALGVGGKLVSGVADDIVETTVPEGIVYLRKDLNGSVLPYAGQSRSETRFLERQVEHARTNPDADFEFTIVDRADPGVPLDVAEHLYVQQLTNGVRARRSPDVSNLNDPVGPARRPGLDLPEPNNR